MFGWEALKVKESSFPCVPRGVYKFFPMTPLYEQVLINNKIDIGSVFIITETSIL